MSITINQVAAQIGIDPSAVLAVAQNAVLVRMTNVTANEELTPEQANKLASYFGKALTHDASAVSGGHQAADIPLEERCKNQWDADPKLRSEFADSFSTFLAYEKASAAGTVRVLSGRGLHRYGPGGVEVKKS